MATASAWRSKLIEGPVALTVGFSSMPVMTKEGVS